MTAVVACIYANGRIQLLEKYRSESTTAFLAVGNGNGIRDVSRGVYAQPRWQDF